MKLSSYLTLPIFVLALTLGVGAPALAAKKSQETSKKRSATVRLKQTQNNSGESASEREKRLLRECRGLPNAGACAGYTHR